MNEAALTELRDWLFRAVTFEAEAERFRASGIRLGADQREVEARLLEEALSPFSLETRNQALAMSRLYAIVFCMENAVRQLIRSRMTERHGVGWWAEKVPRRIQEAAQRTQEDARTNSWLEGDTTEPLSFTNFGHLSDIVTANWDDFSDIITSQHWIKQKFDEIEKARNWIAHNRLLLGTEFARLEMYVRDWTNQVE